MNYYSREYTLINDNIVLKFDSEKQACEFLGVRQSSVCSCWRRGRKCKGYTIQRGEITTHHGTKTRLFKIWSGMFERCERQKHPHYNNYGGRGITICDEWHIFNNFRDWALNNGYDRSLTIDRIDVNGNYEPHNCRWVTIQEQANNKRSNHNVTICGETLTATQCSKKYNIPLSTVISRDNRGRDILTGAKMDGAKE